MDLSQVSSRSAGRREVRIMATQKKKRVADCECRVKKAIMAMRKASA